MNTPAWTFQDRLRKAREHVGMTQSELAEATGVSLNSLNRYEKGQRSPGEDIVKSISDATGVPFEWFYQVDTAEGVRVALPKRLVLNLEGEVYRVVHE